MIEKLDPNYENGLLDIHDSDYVKFRENLLYLNMSNRHGDTIYHCKISENLALLLTSNNAELRDAAISCIAQSLAEANRKPRLSSL